MSDRLCVCGAELVEEDKEVWRISFETQSPYSDDWHPVEALKSKHAAHQQHEGLLMLIEQGEPIRNVKLEQVAS